MPKFVVRYSLALCGLLFIVPLGHSQEAQQRTSSDANCDSLNVIVKENVKAIASTLGVCRDMKRLLLRTPANGALSSIQLNSEPAGNKNEASTGQAPAVKQLEEEKQQLEARQRVNEAATRAILNANATLLQVQSALLQYQMTILTDEQKAYNRTKLLNAFLGTTVGAIGTGMQFSSSTSVQHAGDAVGVAGGVITTVFALCTAELAPESSSGDRLLAAFTNGNEQHVVPESVWSYVQADPAFMSSMSAFAKTPAPAKKGLSCHLHAPASNQLVERQNALNELNGKLSMMNHDVADLLQTLPQN